MGKEGRERKIMRKAYHISTLIIFLFLIVTMTGCVKNNNIVSVVPLPRSPLTKYHYNSYSNQQLLTEYAEVNARIQDFEKQLKRLNLCKSCKYPAGEWQYKMLLDKRQHITQEMHQRNLSVKIYKKEDAIL